MRVGDINITLTRPKEKMSALGKRYISFWVEVYVGGELGWIAVSGWKYFPEKGMVSTPSISKGAGKGFVNMVEVAGGFYNAIQTEAKGKFGGNDGSHNN